MSSAVSMQTVAPLHLAAVRDRASPRDLASKIGQHVGTVLQHLRAVELKFNRCVVLYAADDAPQPSTDADFSIAVGWEVDPPFTGDGTVVPVSTPAGTAATATHIGPYDRMGDAHRAIHDWCAQNHHRLAGPSWEVYDHPRDGQPSRTDVYYLVA